MAASPPSVPDRPAARWSRGGDGWREQQDPYSCRCDVELALQGDPFDQCEPLHAGIADWQQLDQRQSGVGEVIALAAKPDDRTVSVRPVYSADPRRQRITDEQSVSIATTSLSISPRTRRGRAG